MHESAEGPGEKESRENEAAFLTPLFSSDPFLIFRKRRRHTSQRATAKRLLFTHHTEQER